MFDDIEQRIKQLCIEQAKLIFYSSYSKEDIEYSRYINNQLYELSKMQADLDCTPFLPYRMK